MPWDQLLLILNNIFPFRLHKTVSMATPPKYIPAFDKKSFFDIQAVSRRKNGQYQQYLKTWKECTTENQICFLPGELVYDGTLTDHGFYALKFFT